MKIALLADLHFGVKKSADYFFDSQLKFFENQFFPYLDEHGIKDIFILGDIMDNRDHINVKILSNVFKLFRERFSKYNTRVIVGNHDSYLKTDIKINSVKMLESIDNIHVFDEIAVDEDIEKKTGKKITMVPWVVDIEGFNNWLNSNIHGDYCFGHFELSGFSLIPGYLAKSENDPCHLLSCFDRIYTGHFHKRERKDFSGKFVEYIGSPYQITRNDINTERGFTILDVETGEEEFIENTQSIKFIRYTYPEKINPEEVRGNVVDVTVMFSDTENDEAFLKYVAEIESAGSVFTPTVKIIDENAENQEDIVIEHKSIETVMKEYIDTLEYEEKETIYLKLLELFNKATE